MLGGERDARQVFHRLAGAWTHWGDTHGYFDTPADARTFYDEICHMLAAQVAAPNSPQWFNTGLHWAYGLSGPAQGHHYVEPDTGVLTRATSAYERPQPSACQPYHALVSTPSGPVAIGDIVTKHLVGLEVYDGRQAGGGTTRVVAVKHNGEKVVFAIALKNGVCIEATGDHLVLATAERRTDTAWCRVDELRPGMRLQLSTRTAVIADSDDRAIDEAALAGWLQGDGFVGQYAHGTNRSLTLEFMTINKDELEFVLERVERVFPNVHYHVRHVDAKTAGLDVRRIRLYGAATERVPALPRARLHAERAACHRRHRHEASRRPLRSTTAGQAGGGTTRVVAVKHNGEKAVFAIALKNGVSIEATGDHLVLATAERRTGTAWCRVDELRPACGCSYRRGPRSSRTRTIGPLTRRRSRAGSKATASWGNTPTGRTGASRSSS